MDPATTINPQSQLWEQPWFTQERVVSEDDTGRIPALREREIRSMYPTDLDRCQAVKLVYDTHGFDLINEDVANCDWMQNEGDLSEDESDIVDFFHDAMEDDSKFGNPTSKALVVAMDTLGFAFCSYFTFVRKDSPMYMAHRGEIPLKPECFNVCMGIGFIADGEKMRHRMVACEKGRERQLLRLDYTCRGAEHKERTMANGWNRKALKDAIRKHGLSLSQQAIRDKNERLRSILTLALITGNLRDSDIVLPGFGINYYENDSAEAQQIADSTMEDPDFNLIFWGAKRMSTEYYALVYRLLLKTDRFMDLSFEEFQTACVR